LYSKLAELAEEVGVLREVEAAQKDSAAQLESAYTERLARLRSTSERQQKVLEDSLRATEARLTAAAEGRELALVAVKQLEVASRDERAELEARLRSEAAEARRERDELLGQRENSSKLIAELTRKVNQIEAANIAMTSRVNEAEMEALVRERDSLLAVIEQQNRDHESIQRMSQASLRMLHQRQSLLDERDFDGDLGGDGVLRLQDSMQAMLAREGGILQSEMVDAK
jgi:hypothetical protein